MNELIVLGILLFGGLIMGGILVWVITSTERELKAFYKELREEDD